MSPSFLVTIPVDSPFAEAQMKAVTWKSKSLAQAIAFLRLLQTGKVASVLVSSLRAGTLLLTIPQLNKQVVTTMKSPRITPLEVPRTRAKSPTEALFGEIDREVAEWEAYKAQRNRAQSARLQRAKEAVQKLKACRVDELAHFCTQCPILSLEQVQP